MTYCPACAEEAIFQSGDASCEYLIIEEFPELVMPTPKVTQWMSKRQKEEWTPRKILVNELAKFNMVLQQFYILSAYPHQVPDNGQPEENCYAAGMANVCDMLPRYKGVIVLGTNLCKEFTGLELKQVCGLSGVPSKYIPDGDTPRVFLPTLRSIFSTGAGEFTLGLERFIKQLGVE